MNTLDKQVEKMEKFRVTNKLVIHPKREIKGGILFMAKLFLSINHCPCKINRTVCPCKEALLEIKTMGYCECRLFCTKKAYDKAKALMI